MRKVLSNIFFWMGDFASKILCVGNNDSEWWAKIWYPIYNNLMIVSCNLDPDAWITEELGKSEQT